jgi:hypothetical protein
VEHPISHLASRLVPHGFYGIDSSLVDYGNKLHIGNLFKTRYIFLDGRKRCVTELLKLLDVDPPPEVSPMRTRKVRHATPYAVQWLVGGGYTLRGRVCY